MTARPATALAAVAVLLLLAGCGSAHRAERTTPPATHRSTATAPSPPASSLPPDPASVHANELGQIPVLMFHRVVPDPTGDYDTSPDELRALLTTLAVQGYVPVTMADVAVGRIDIPAGRSPVVLTFDDGSATQLTLDAAGDPTPDCAVGVLQAVAAAHPGFTATASFYVNQHAFGQSDPSRYLRWLAGHGYEVGDHTKTHANLHDLSASAVQEEIGAIQAVIRGALGHGASTLALPFGAEPDPASLALEGGSGPGAYDFDAVLLVGANPAPSPYSTAWKPGAVPRLRAAHHHVEYDATWWLPKIAASRYVSDGDPAHISFPRAELPELNPADRGRAQPY